MWPSCFYESHRTVSREKRPGGTLGNNILLVVLRTAPAFFLPTAAAPAALLLATASVGSLLSDESDKNREWHGVSVRCGASRHE